MALIKILIEMDKEIWLKFKSLAVERGHLVSSGHDNAVERVLKGELEAFGRI